VDIAGLARAQGTLAIGPVDDAGRVPALLHEAVKETRSGKVVVVDLRVRGVPSQAEAETLHTYGSSIGQDLVTVIAVDASKLLPLLPKGYTLVPASLAGFGGPDQGVVVMAEFRAIDPTVDQRKPLTENEVAIDIAILVVEPAHAAQAGVNIPGAFHLYTLAIYTNDARYAASLNRGDMPVDFVNKIEYQRDMNDNTGVGNLAVAVPAKESPFHTLSVGQGYAPVPGAAFNVVFWHDGRHEQAVLHFLNQPFRQGTAISQIYTEPHSRWDRLLNGGGLGPCAPHPVTGYGCVIAPALNLRYDEGGKGRLLSFDD